MDDKQDYQYTNFKPKFNFRDDNELKRLAWRLDRVVNFYPKGLEFEVKYESFGSCSFYPIGEVELDTVTLTDSEAKITSTSFRESNVSIKYILDLYCIWAKRPKD